MPEIGYALSSEEHGPKPLIQYAGMAEQAGFTFAVISGHSHFYQREILPEFS